MVRKAIACLNVVGLLALGACGGAEEPTGATPAGTSAGGWIPYTHEPTGFKVEFPAAPTENSSEQQTAWGAIQTFMIESRPPSSELAYRVRADIYPMQVYALGDETSLIFARQKRYEVDIKGKTLAEEPASVGEKAGKQFTFELEDGSLEIARVFIDTSHLAMYHVSVFTPAHAKDRSEVTRFLDSFSITPAAAPEG